jgi:hypothetical protein
MGDMRTFDPVRIGRLETVAWVTYYRHEWVKFLRAAVGLTYEAFGLGWPRTLYGAWLVLRANQLWAPVPDNDPGGARETMRRFYLLVKRRHGERFDPVEAARLEVEWWRVHRLIQREDPSAGEEPLVAALSALWAYVYGVEAPSLRRAAQERALAMRYSDEWVEAGCALSSPLIGLERAALVRSYAALLAAVHR